VTCVNAAAAVVVAAAAAAAVEGELCCLPLQFHTGHLHTAKRHKGYMDGKHGCNTTMQVARFRVNGVPPNGFDRILSYTLPHVSSWQMPIANGWLSVTLQLT
jgi:hypothetical protein